MNDINLSVDWWEMQELASCPAVLETAVLTLTLHSLKGGDRRNRTLASAVQAQDHSH